MDVKAAVQHQFGQVADNYAASAVHIGGPDLDAMLAAAPDQADQMLDVGCGTGHTAIAFAGRVDQITAIDLTEPMLAQGRRLAAEHGIENIAFEAGDVEQLAFPDQSFDLITSRYSAHHYPHPDRALTEIARVLKPGGVLLLIDVIAPSDPTQDTFLNTIELLRDPSHVRDHPAEQWQRMIDRAGFRAELLETWPLRLDFEAWTTRMRTPSMAVAQIRSLFHNAPREVREAFTIEHDYSFTIPVALLRGTRA